MSMGDIQKMAEDIEVSIIVELPVGLAFYSALKG